MDAASLLTLAEAMISRSFPGLRGMTVKLEMIDSDDCVMAVGLCGREIHLDVSREDAIRMGRRATIGVLAHELCHAEEDRRHGPLLDGVLSSLYRLIPYLETRMERRIDGAVIRKGYGKELLAFGRYHDRHYEPYDPADGLTPAEIAARLRDGSPADRHQAH